ncbi:hypothetical protein RIF29_33703 [Crotalaria pallida]|uniref:peroxidase n=1 Tax=Crotalaria pallida TaxID=3830 RepID=A0AAN9EAB6_CROPI
MAALNLTLRGFEVIDKAKEALKLACPSTVLCDDIITLATRDSVALAERPRYPVATGRRDGLLANVNGTEILPGPNSRVFEALGPFIQKGLSLEDMVTLLGAGFAHCNFFRNRLPNDPTMDKALAAFLKGVLFIDQQLALDPASKPFVSLFAANSTTFQQRFANAVIKMGRIGVLVNEDGEIRKNCRVFNAGGS